MLHLRKINAISSSLMDLLDDISLPPRRIEKTLQISAVFIRLKILKLLEPFFFIVIFLYEWFVEFRFPPQLRSSNIRIFMSLSPHICEGLLGHSSLFLMQLLGNGALS